MDSAVIEGTDATPLPARAVSAADKAAYASAIFASALLLFLIQPMIAKQLLPRFGGAASVWTACMMFFQVMLLLGYLYAHWSTKHLSCRAQGITHSVLIALGAALSWIPPGKTGAVDHPVWGVIGLLAGSVGVPYFVLSATSPLLQSWYSTVGRTRVPYRLFAVSNLGSLLALLAYPVMVEPALELRLQLQAWRLAYLVFAGFGMAVAWRAICCGTPKSPRPGMPATGHLSEKALWVALAACPSALLLAITNNLCQVMAPVPLLWIAPLAVYLITFIVCFDHGPLFGRAVSRVLVPAALMAMVWVQGHLDTPLLAAVSLYLGALFVVAMFCHGQLVELKPEASRVTSFYLCISLGGAMGGIFVGLAAPKVFPDFFELQVAVVASLLLSLRLLFHYRSRTFLGITGVAALLLLRILTDSTGKGVEFRGRNFYAALAVSQNQGFRELLHGKVIHGSQLVSSYGSSTAPEPTTYYGRQSGMGIALERAHGPQRVGAVGLGAGTLAAYGRPGDSFRFYELNPMVEKLARSRFTYLGTCRASVEVVLGDARLSLENEPNQNFDTLVLDAFSGDAIPTHLMTREAFRCYFRHVKPDGLIAVHVSNEYLNLAPLVAGLAADHGWQTLRVESPADKERGISRAIWALVSPDGEYLRGLERQRIGRVLTAGRTRLWTDQYSNILAVLWR